MVNGQRGFLDRNLEHYPPNAQRIKYLALSVAATIVLYYQFYVLPSVLPLVLAQFHITFTNYINLILFSNLLGAIASLIGGFSDRLGRANLVVFGTLVTSIITLSITFAQVGTVFVALTLVGGFVEGIVLVATPALVRDFSPRMGRATAMAFWTIGPVGGSLLVTLMTSLTLTKFNNSWQSQYTITAIAGVIVAVLCFLGLRDLSPNLRAQIMTALKEQALLEARARGMDVDATVKHPWRQMLTPRIIFSSLGVSVFLLFYYATVSYYVTYYHTIFGYSLPLANELLLLYWIADVISSIVGGIICDRLGVRKPFMLIGTVASIILGLVFISRTGVPTPPIFFALLGIGTGLFGPVAYVGWMASFTETVEDVNPALVATGIAVWGSLLRLVVVVSTIGVNMVLGNNPQPAQWATWWWVCEIGLIVFLPTIFLTSGYWKPARAHAETEAKLRAEGLGEEASVGSM